MSNIKLFVTHTPNRNTMRISDNKYICNVIAGSDFQTKELPEGVYKDNDGDNISSKNKSYCELTTQYWAWKNIEADYYGFCHYRRFFSFNDERLKETEWGTVEYDYLTEKEKLELKLNENDIKKFIENYDFIIAAPVKTKQLDAISVYNHYEKAPELHIKDVDLFLQIIKEKYEYLYDVAVEFFKGEKFYPCNMFIAKKDLFNEYSALMFDILEEFEKRADMSEYSREGYRTTGHLGERLTGIYYEYLKKQGGYRLKEAQIALIHNADAEDEVEEIKPEGIIPIVLAANEKYVPIMYTCAQSIVDNTSKDYTYKFFIFHTDITADSQNMFISRLTRDNVSIHFVNVGSRVANYILQAKQHITTETFYRFLILDILKDYPKVIYLDSDMIICRDVADLYNVDLGNNLIAGAKDPDFSGQCNMKNSEMRQYCKNTLDMDNPFDYFQAGVLVLNVAELNKVTTVQKMFEMADTGIYRFSDQDILNIICKNRVTYLDQSWNMIFDCDHFRWHEVIKYAPYEILDEYEEARKHPYIIHYAGFLKPWMRPGEDFGYVFWEVARRTPYYEIILSMIEGMSTGKPTEVRPTKLVLTRKLLMKVFKPGSGIRAKLGKIYWKLFG